MSYLIKSLLWAVCLSSMSIQFAMAAEGSDDPGQSFSIAHDADFQHASEVVSRLIRSRGMAKVKNNFCIVGYKNISEKFAWVYWINRSSLILWEPQKQRVADLSRSRRQLDMHRDVVSDDASLRGSSYRVTHAWVDHLVHDCDMVGLKISIDKK